MRPKHEFAFTLSDRRTADARRIFRLVRNMRPANAAEIPLTVYREFIDMLYGMWLPILGLGIVFVSICIFVMLKFNAPGYAALAALGAMTTLWRILEVHAYLRSSPDSDLESLKRWERRYAAGNYASAALLGALNILALSIHYPMLHLITVSLVFSFGAGVVARISVRPKICIISLLLATVPTVGALTLHAITDHSDSLHAEMFVIEAVLVAMITGLSLQTVAHLYRSAVDHHTVKHDLAQLAQYDALTGLPNRLLLRARFHSSLTACLRLDQSLALYFLDLDGFKAINDQHGHPAGDALLEQVAHRLEAIVRTNDTVARLGGDEFVVLQGGLRHNDEAKLLAGRIIRRLSEPYVIDGITMQVSVSVGIAIAQGRSQSLEQMLSRADAALYEAKANGKGRALFSPVADDLNAQNVA